MIERLLNGPEDVAPALFLADHPVLAFCIGELLRLAGQDVRERDRPLGRPCLQCPEDIFRSIIDPDASRLAAPLDDPVERARNSQHRPGQIGLDGETFEIEVVTHIQRLKRAPVAELVGHDVHRPRIVRRRWNRRKIGPLASKLPPRLDAQIEIQLAAHPVDALMVPALGFDVAQMQKVQAEASPAKRRRQTDEPIGDLRVLAAEHRLLAKTGLADAKCSVRQRPAHAAFVYCLAGQLPPLRWPRYTFLTASFSTYSESS